MSNPPSHQDLRQSPASSTGAVADNEPYQSMDMGFPTVVHNPYADSLDFQPGESSGRSILPVGTDADGEHSHKEGNNDMENPQVFPEENIEAGQAHVAATQPAGRRTFAAFQASPYTSHDDFAPPQRTSGPYSHQPPAYVPPSPMYTFPSGSYEETQLLTNLFLGQAPIAPRGPYQQYAPTLGSFHTERDAVDTPGLVHNLRGSTTLGAVQNTGSPLDHNSEDERPKVKQPRRKKDEVLPCLVGQQPTPGWRPGDGLREPTPPRLPSGLFFSSFEEARERAPCPDWECPKDDPTIPMDDNALKTYVARLLAAMVDMTQFKDGPSTTMKKRWLDRPWVKGQKNGAQLSNEYYSKHNLERLAWRVAKACQNLHLHGPGVFECLDPAILEQSFEWRKLSYAERIDMFVELFTLYKARVDSAMHIGVVEEYVLTVGKLKKSSITNGVANSRRQKWLKDGREKAKGTPDNNRTVKDKSQNQISDDDAKTVATTAPDSAANHEAPGHLSDPQADSDGQNTTPAEDMSSELSEHDSDEFEDLETFIEGWLRSTDPVMGHDSDSAVVNAPPTPSRKRARGDDDEASSDGAKKVKAS